jgi:Flp pilus assembly protein TadB
MMLAGAGVGAGLWTLAAWLFPPRPPLDDVLARFAPTPTVATTDTAEAAPGAAPPAAGGDVGWAARLGRPFADPLHTLGLPTPALRRDLAAVGRDAQAHLAEKSAAGLAGLFLPAAVGALLALGGRGLPWVLPAGAALLLAGAGFLAPDLAVRAEARRRRASFRHALSAYLNLVQVLLAGGAGVEGALTDAAGVGRGWPFARLRRALATARATRTTPWAALGDLGRELDVAELVELAAAVSLAGTEGARVRASLAAKAAALRSRAAADVEAAATAATERMSIPGVVLAAGFILFVFYPALAQVSSSL